jgi:NitT/TauT family transport system substrate-binding protein
MKLQKRAIKIAQFAQINCAYLPLYVAIQQGYFKQCGIEVELILSGNDDDIFKSVISKQADFGLGDPTFCAMSKKKHTSPIAKIIAPICNRLALWGITHNPVIHHIKTERDLVGLRLVCFPSPSTSHALLSTSKANHKRLLRSMKIIEAPIGSQSDLLMGDKVDIVLYTEPFVSIAESNGWRTIYSPSNLYGDYVCSGLYASTDFIEKNKDLVDDVKACITKALKTLHQQPEIGIKTAQIYFPDIKSSILRLAVKRCSVEEIWPETSLVSNTAWAKAVKIRKQYGEHIIDDIYSALYQE